MIGEAATTPCGESPNRTISGATAIPLNPQLSMIGVTTPAAAVAPAPVVPCT